MAEDIIEIIKNKNVPNVEKIAQLAVIFNQGVTLEAIKDDDGNTPLMVAALLGVDQVFIFLWDHYKSQGLKDQAFVYTNKIGSTLAHQASKGGAVSIIKCLHQDGLDFETFTRKGSKPIHGVIFGGHYEALCYLIDTVKVDYTVSQADEWGNTALMLAANAGHAKLFKYLLAKYKADGKIGDALAMKYKNGESLVDAVYAVGNLTILSALYEAGFNCTPPPVLPNKSHDVAIIKWMLSRNINLVYTTIDGKLPLHFFAAEGNVEVFDQLIQAGYWSWWYDDPYKKSPLGYAIENGHVELVNYIFEQYPSIQQRYLERHNFEMPSLFAPDLHKQSLFDCLVEFYKKNIGRQNIKGPFMNLLNILINYGAITHTTPSKRNESLIKIVYFQLCKVGIAEQMLEILSDLIAKGIINDISKIEQKNLAWIIASTPPQSYDNIDKFLYLLSQIKFNINQKNSEGQTLLHSIFLLTQMSVSTQSIEKNPIIPLGIILRLLKHGAEPFTLDNQGIPAIQILRIRKTELNALFEYLFSEGHEFEEALFNEYTRIKKTESFSLVTNFILHYLPHCYKKVCETYPDLLDIEKASFNWGAGLQWCLPKDLEKTKSDIRTRYLTPIIKSINERPFLAMGMEFQFINRLDITKTSLIPYAITNIEKFKIVVKETPHIDGTMVSLLLVLTAFLVNPLEKFTDETRKEMKNVYFAMVDHIIEMRSKNPLYPEVVVKTCVDTCFHILAEQSSLFTNEERKILGIKQLHIRRTLLGDSKTLNSNDNNNSNANTTASTENHFPRLSECCMNTVIEQYPDHSIKMDQEERDIIKQQINPPNISPIQWGLFWRKFSLVETKPIEMEEEPRSPTRVKRSKPDYSEENDNSNHTDKQMKPVFG